MSEVKAPKLSRAERAKIIKEQNINKINLMLRRHKRELEEGEVQYIIGPLLLPNLNMRVYMPAPEGSLYEGGYFTFMFILHGTKSPPVVKPLEILPHPCISAERVGLDVLNSMFWYLKMNMLTAADQVMQLLRYPEMGRAVNKEVLKVFLNDPEKFKEDVRAAVKKQQETPFDHKSWIECLDSESQT